jgi:hypothetical protein
MPSFPSSLSFVSFLQYAPKGHGPRSQESKRFTQLIKNDGHFGSEGLNAISYATRRLAESCADHPCLQACFTPETTLIPVPRRSPLMKGWLWPTLRICETMLNCGLAMDVLPSLVRVKVCTKSATADGAQNRPSPLEHYQTSEVQHSTLLQMPTKITLVDDVLTRGSTFVGMYAHLREAYPEAEIRCFALIRTESPGEIESMFAPTEGTITYWEPNTLQARITPR